MRSKNYSVVLPRKWNWIYVNCANKRGEFSLFPLFGIEKMNDIKSSSERLYSLCYHLHFFLDSKLERNSLGIENSWRNSQSSLLMRYFVDVPTFYRPRVQWLRSLSNLKVPRSVRERGENSRKYYILRAISPNLVVMNELIHSSRSECTFQDVCHCHCGVDVTHQLRLALRSIRHFAEKDDLRLLRNGKGEIQDFSKEVVSKGRSEPSTK